MNILITGGCGFIGSNLAVGLRNEGHEVVCFDNLSRRGSEIILDRILENGCKFVHGDIRNAEDLQKIKQDSEILIECSAEPSVLVGSNGNDARFMLENNLVGAINCFEYSRERRLAVLFLSTSRVYPYNALNRLAFKETETRFDFEGKSKGVTSEGVELDFPLEGVRSLYGATKLSGEYILQEYSANYGINSIIDRCGVIAGPWQLGKADQGVFTFWLLNHFFKKGLRYIGFGGLGKQVRDLLHVEDLVRLVKIQISNISKYSGEVFNVGGGRDSNLSLQETTELCVEITGNRLRISPEIVDRPADVIWYLANNSKVSREFKWSSSKKPVDILSDTYEWIKANEGILKKISKGN